MPPKITSFEEGRKTKMKCWELPRISRCVRVQELPRLAILRVKIRGVYGIRHSIRCHTATTWYGTTNRPAYGHTCQTRRPYSPRLMYGAIHYIGGKVRNSRRIYFEDTRNELAKAFTFMQRLNADNVADKDTNKSKQRYRVRIKIL